MPTRPPYDVPRANFADNPVGLAACHLRPCQPRLILFSLDLMARATATKSTDPEEQPRTFIDKFEPKHQTVIRAARKALRKSFPTATELGYDNYNFFVIGFGPTERPSDCIVSIAAAANGVGLCFIRGASLPDPVKVLLGSGKQTRFVRLPTAEVLQQPAVQALLTVAANRAKTPLPGSGRGRLIIRSVSAKQRSRRKPRKA
jgi:hypothetical protein